MKEKHTYQKKVPDSKAVVIELWRMRADKRRICLRRGLPGQHTLRVQLSVVVRTDTSSLHTVTQPNY